MTDAGDSPLPAGRNGAARDRSVQKLLRVGTWGQTLVQESVDGQGARLVHEIAVRPGEVDGALALVEAWRAFHHPTLHTLQHGTVAQPAGSPGQVLRLERPLPRGTPLAQVLPRAALGEDAVAALFVDLAKGLAELHAAGLVAGNLSAETLLLCPPGQDDAAPLLLVDAGLPGIVIAASGPLGDVANPRLGQLLAVPEVVAPEVLAGQAPTPAADLFALCAVLAGTLLGRPVFEAASTAALRAAMAQGPAPTAMAELTSTAPHLAAILQRGLAAQPWARAGVLAELIEALTARCGGLPTTLADERTVLAPWAPGSPLIALAAYASSVPWSAQFPESAVVVASSAAAAAGPEGQAKLRAALDELELERRRGQTQAETQGRNVLSRLIIVALFGLLAAAIAATAVRQAHRAQLALHPQRAADTLAPPPIKPLPKPRVLFETPPPE